MHKQSSMPKQLWHTLRASAIIASWIVIGVISLPTAVVVAALTCPSCYFEIRQAVS